eukprot:COSAG06_NODE_9269_length_1943_cov_1.141540_1_plen_104_part_10
MVLTRDVTIDYDMVNAHPTIALALCKQLFPDESWYKPLGKYVANHDVLIAQLWGNCSRADLCVSEYGEGQYDLAPVDPELAPFRDGWRHAGSDHHITLCSGLWR